MSWPLCMCIADYILGNNKTQKFVGAAYTDPEVNK